MFSPGVELALRTALQAHDGDLRKGETDIPYVVHPLHVALMLTRFDVDEEVVQAGILHDVVEDCDGWSVERVEEMFGARVASIVAEVTEDKSRTWEERKEAGIRDIERLSEEACLVKACDKLHNLHSLVDQLSVASDPGQVWARFRGGRERTVATSAALVNALSRRIPRPLSEALEGALQGLRALAAS